MPDPYLKSRAGAPAGFFATEAAGLAWLAAAGGAPVVGVQEVGESALVLDRLQPVRPEPAAARVFGRALAATHAAGAEKFGTLPPGAAGYWFGPLSDPLPLPTTTAERFGAFYAQARLWPLTQRCRRAGAIDADLEAQLARLRAELHAGRWDSMDGELLSPARLHGDFWSGNVIWTADGATLIDPAAYGGHPEADLAMLDLFGAPYLAEIIAGYAEAGSLAADWRSRIGLHQVFPLLVHALLFGGSYAEAARAAVASALS